MESKANYALIGAFVLMAVVAMLGFIAYISGQQFDEQYDEYLVAYTTPPRGITVGSEVRYNEIKMGEVIDVDLDKDNPDIVLARIRVKSTTRIYEDTYGRNEPLGLTGLSYIQLYAGESRELVTGVAGSRDLIRIEGRESQFDNLLGRSDSIISNVNIALRRASNVLSPEAAEDFHGILKNVNSITKAVAGSDLSNERVEAFMGAIEQAALDVSTAALSVDVTAKDVSGFLGGDEIKAILIQADIVLKTAETTLNEYTILAQHGTQLSDEAARMVEQFTATGLQDLSTSMTDLRNMMETLNRIVADLERSPIEFIAGQKKEITELPQ